MSVAARGLEVLEKASVMPITMSVMPSRIGKLRGRGSGDQRRGSFCAHDGRTRLQGFTPHEALVLLCMEEGLQSRPSIAQVA